MARKKKTTIRIRQTRSAIGRPRGQRETLRGLGLRRPHQVVEREDTAAVRGMAAKIPHLVAIVDQEVANVDQEVANVEEA